MRTMFLYQWEGMTRFISMKHIVEVSVYVQNDTMCFNIEMVNKENDINLMFHGDALSNKNAKVTPEEKYNLEFMQRVLDWAETQAKLEK